MLSTDLLVPPHPELGPALVRREVILEGQLLGPAATPEAAAHDVTESPETNTGRLACMSN